MSAASAAGRGDPELARTLAEWRRRNSLRRALALAVTVALAASLAASGGLELNRYADAGSTIVQLLIDATPPDFTRAPSWIKPLFETIAMSVAATLAGSVAALPLALDLRSGPPPREELVDPAPYSERKAITALRAHLGGLLGVTSNYALERLDAAVRQIRQNVGRRHVAITTWASFASMWLIPRLEAFQRQHPDIDVRIDATDTPVDLDTTDVDLALRYSAPANLPAQAQRLFGEQLTPVLSPWLLKSAPHLEKPQDLAQFALIEAGDAHRHQHVEWLSWQRWFAAQQLTPLEPKRWLSFNYAHQIAQAALAGQGVALVRTPLVAESLASGDLVEPFPLRRLDSPLAYWLIVGQRSAARPEVLAFCDWLRAQAAQTREAIGDMPDPQTLDRLD